MVWLLFFCSFNCIALIHPKNPYGLLWETLGGKYCRSQGMTKLCRWREQKAVQKLGGKCLGEIGITGVHLCFEQLRSFCWGQHSSYCFEVLRSNACPCWSSQRSYCSVGCCFSRDAPVLEILIQSRPYDWADPMAFNMFFQTWAFVQMMSIL